MVVAESETGLELVGQLMADPVFIVRTDGTIVTTSEGWLIRFGVTKQDILGKSIFELDFLPAKSRDTICNNLASRLVGNHATSYEVSLYTADGEERFFLGAGCLAIFRREPVDIIRLVDVTEARRAEEKLQETYEALARTLALALEAKDPYTRGHSERVRLHCQRIARVMNLSAKKIKALERAASLHDIGKIAVPDAILSKPGPLTTAEFAQVQLHPEKSVEVVRMIPNPRDTLLAIRHHHERPDGKGYPDGIGGDDIPLNARILAVADAYDALTSERPYRKAYSHKETIRILKNGAGTQWDAQVVDAAVNALG